MELTEREKLELEDILAVLQQILMVWSCVMEGCQWVGEKCADYEVEDVSQTSSSSCSVWITLPWRPLKRWSK